MKKVILGFFTLIISLCVFSQMHYGSATGGHGSISHTTGSTHSSRSSAIKSYGKTSGSNSIGKSKSKSFDRSKIIKVKRGSSFGSSNSFGGNNSNRSSNTATNAYGSYKPSKSNTSKTKKKEMKIAF